MITEPIGNDPKGPRQPDKDAGPLGAPAAPAPAASEARDFSTIAGDVTLRHALHSTAPVRISGSVIGSVECPWVDIDVGARIQGDIRASTVTLRGTVDGSIDGESVLIAGSARVRGSVTADKLRAEDGAMIDGRTHPAVQIKGPPARDLARIARRPQVVTALQPGCLRLLKAQGLVFEREQVAFVTIHGLQALDRKLWQQIGVFMERRHWKRHEQGLSQDDAEALIAVKSADPDLTRIARDLNIACDIVTTGDLHIAGNVTGMLHCRSGTVDYGARVDGDIRAGTVTLCGHVTGSVSADDIVVDASARVEGMVGFGNEEEPDAANQRRAEQLTWTGPAPERPTRREGPGGVGVAARVDAHLNRLSRAA